MSAKLIHMYAMTHSHVCHNSCTFMTWLIHMCVMTHSYVCLFHSHVCHDSCTCMPWLIHMCAMTHLYVCHVPCTRLRCLNSLPLSLTLSLSHPLSLLPCSLSRALSPSFFHLSLPPSLSHTQVCSLFGAWRKTREGKSRGCYVTVFCSMVCSVPPPKRASQREISPVSVRIYTYMYIYIYVYITFISLYILLMLDFARDLNMSYKSHLKRGGGDEKWKQDSGQERGSGFESHVWHIHEHIQKQHSISE